MNEFSYVCFYVSSLSMEGDSFIISIKIDFYFAYNKWKRKEKKRKEINNLFRSSGL